MKISTILDQIDLGVMALPEFQRGYVWNRDQVRRLMSSLYKRYPVGSLLVWSTQTETARMRGETLTASNSVELILDGQQRITSLYGILRGQPPKFFDGHDSFSGLYFNLEEEAFNFYMPTKMQDNPLWVSVTELMRSDPTDFMDRLYGDPQLQPNAREYLRRLNRLGGIKDVELHVEQVTGDAITIDEVVEIFNEVNSGGTKLSKGDLALAKICAEWAEARDEMKMRLSKWRDAGFSFKLELLLRVINTIVTGEALFSALKNVTAAEFREGLHRAEAAIDTLLNMISSRLGLDHDRVLGSVYSFPLMARYLDERSGSLSDYQERDRLLYWYIHTLLWGRYAASTESVLNKDLATIEEREGALGRLIDNLRRDRGDLRIFARDFEGWSRGARFYPFLYMMTRVWHAKDWETGLDLSEHLLGRLSNLQVHHIFPKALLYEYGYDRPQVNAIANFTFLTQDTNLKVSARNPAEYLEEYDRKHPGAVESHWIPMDRDLWRPENYLEFLAVRRELLAEAANGFLDGLYHGSMLDVRDAPSVLERERVSLPGTVATEEEEELLIDLNDWVVAQGLPEGEFTFELVDETGKPLAILDLAWPDGLQTGYSQSVALLIDEPDEVHDLVNTAGYRYFTDTVSFKQYVLQEILARQNGESVRDEGQQGNHADGWAEFEASQSVQTVISPSEGVSEIDTWQQVIDLVKQSDDRWSELAESLSRQRLPAPKLDDVLLDLTQNEVVTGDTALLVWRRGNRAIALAGNELADRGYNMTVVNTAPDSDAVQVAEAVRRHLESTP